MRFAFIDREKAAHSVARLCRVLKVSPSGYYAWRRRGPSARTQRDAQLSEAIIARHRRSRGTYGALRIHADLRASGIRCGRKRVARLMRAAQLVGVHRRRSLVTTRRAPEAPTAPDRVQRRFTTPAPNRLWTADITAIPTQQDWLYLAVVLDVYSRRIAGWAMAEHLQTPLVLQALEMAVQTRRPAPGLIHHSDHGSQYTSLRYGTRCAQAGILPSLGTVGDCYDNAITESFFASLECELLARQTFASPAHARLAVFDYIAAFYNTQRRHSALGYLAPSAFEREGQRDVA
jgi:putative transposase